MCLQPQGPKGRSSRERSSRSSIVISVAWLDPQKESRSFGHPDQKQKSSLWLSPPQVAGNSLKPYIYVLIIPAKYMPRSPNSYNLTRLFIKNSKSGMFWGRHVTIFVNYFGLLHSFSGGLRGELKVRRVKPME